MICMIFIFNWWVLYNQTKYSITLYSKNVYCNIPYFIYFHMICMIVVLSCTRIFHTLYTLPQFFFWLKKKTWKEQMSTQFAQPLPSGYVKIAIENDPFIVDLPINNGDFPSFFVCLPEGNSCFQSIWRVFANDPSALFVTWVAEHKNPGRHQNDSTVQSGKSQNQCPSPSLITPI